MSAESPARDLTRQARRLLGLSVVPLLLLVLLLAGLQARQAWDAALVQAATGLELQRQAFDTLVRDADRHVDELGQLYLQAGGHEAPAFLRDSLRVRPQADGYSLDGLGDAHRADTAQLLWAGPQAPAPDDLLRARVLGRLAQRVHARQPELVWSYVFSWPEQGLLLFPWVPSTAVMEELGRSSLREGLRTWYGYEVVSAGLGPDAGSYWTAPYLDAGGRGAMVSHAAPLRVGGELQGIAGVDVALRALATPLAALPAAPWQAWVIDRRGHLLADRQQPLTTERLVRASERLDPALLAALPTAEQQPAQAVAAAGWRVFVQPVQGAPWLLLLAAPEPALYASLLPQLLPFALLLAALLALWLWGHVQLGRRVVLPLIALFEHLLALVQRPGLPAPQLGGRWQPWVQRLRGPIADAHQAQARQRTAEALKSSVIDRAQIAIVVIGADDRVHEWNAAAEALFGWSRTEMLGQALHPRICPERFRVLNRAAIAAMCEGDPEGLAGRVLPRRVLNSAGEEIPVELVMWTVQGEGELLVTLSMRDLRAQRATQALIERQREALRQGEKLSAMGSLLASVAHELNNPLTIVVGRAAMLEEACAGTPQAQDALRVREAADRCARIVKTFLTMARSRAPQRQALQLNTLAQAAAELLAYTLRSHGIELELQLDADAPTLLGDPDQLGQIALNLLINAQQALAAVPAPRRIRLQCGHEADSAWLRVADNGPGVPQALRESIFDPFFSTKAEGSGTGLGLSVSRGIAREHGGDLRLLDLPAGACFELRLPLTSP